MLSIMHKKTPIIELHNVRFAYSAGPMVLDDLNFSFFKGERVGILAPNGSGKTTLFHVIMGLLPIHSGTIDIFGRPMRQEKDFSDVRRRIGLLFQDADDQLFCPTVLEDVSFGPLNMGQSKNEAIRISKKTLSLLGLSDFENRLTFKLSGGEKKLVSFATVLAMNPEALLLDEPSTGLDASTRFKIIEILSKMDISYIVISHDIEFLEAVTTQTYTLRAGKMYADDKVYVHRHDHAHVMGHIPHKH
jgi:cobalt/nickel transport system ATP-binding protein